MKCPVDGTALEAHAFHSINVEECLQCHGLWFEEGEFRKAKDDAEPDLNWLDFSLWTDSGALKADWSPRRCPQCMKEMAKISYASTRVSVDYCVEGHGMWLEKGEFEAIIEALDKEENTKTFPEYISASLKEAREIITGNEGFISEWRDFKTVTRLLQYRVLAENPKVAELLLALQLTTPFH